MVNIGKVISTVGKYLNNAGWNVPYLDYAENNVQEYLEWYRGKTNWHNYYVNNGQPNRVQMTRFSLDMAKTCCEDMASLLLNEKVTITMSDAISQEFIDKQLEKQNFWVEGNKLIELMCALGTGAFVQGWNGENKEQTFDYVHGDMIFPLSWENGEVSECAFGTSGKENTDIFYTLYIHEKTLDGTYVIKTVNLTSENKVISPIDMKIKLQDKGLRDDNNAGFSSIIETGSIIPLFQIIRPNIQNNYDKTCPLGMSIYGNAIDILKNLDLTFDGLRNEIDTGKRQLFVKSDLKHAKFAKDSDGLINPIDPNETMYHVLDWDKDDVPFHSFTPEIRTEQYTNAINKELALFSWKVGLGNDFYLFDGAGIARTATEVISTNSSLFRNIRKFELPLEKALIMMCRSIMNIENIFNGGNFDIWQDITINFDDSIIEDTEKKQTNAMAEYNAGLIDRVEYFVKTKDMTREQAIKYVAEMEATNTMKQTLDFMNSGLGSNI